jgi:rubrerythrin
MPVYKCPKCGRTVEKPEGEYYCSVCGPEVLMQRVSEGEERVGELEYVKSSLMDASNDEIADADKYWTLAKKLKELGFKRQAEKVESIAKDEERHNIIISNILKEIR